MGSEIGQLVTDRSCKGKGGNPVHFQALISKLRGELLRPVRCFQADLRDTFPGVVCRYPDKGFDDNYCRNPDGKPRPWCYTLDPDTPWEYCSIKMCGKLGSNLLLPFPLTDSI